MLFCCMMVLCQSRMCVLLHSIFRLLLLRDSTDCFLLIMEGIKQVIKATQDHIENERALVRGGTEPNCASEMMRG